MDKKVEAIVLFDGVCNLCNGFVNWVIDRDPKAKVMFGSLQSEEAKWLLSKFGESPDYLDSIVAIKNDKLYKNSRAVLEICLTIGGVYKLMGVFLIVPNFIRDAVYKWVARNRYKWFGKSESCRIPTPELKSRFL
ncbi:MAG TPA: thiol-disulfide oxidoreductase DCC family protein [Flavobacteriales bacterium]|jgi:predicted DCC family thiol-disulfide oxidoreductase YuxK